MIRKYRKKIRGHFEEVISVKDSPRSIALGFAIGTAIAILPTFGLGALIGIGIILIFKKISKIALLASFVVWNFAILAFLIPIEYRIGNFLLKNIPMTTYKIKILNEIFFYSRNYLLGNLILTVILTGASYLIVYALAKKYKTQYKKIIQIPLEKVIERADKEIKKIEEKVQGFEEKSPLDLRIDNI